MFSALFLTVKEGKLISNSFSIYQDNGAGEKLAQHKGPECPICRCAEPLADHLRQSEECVEALRREPLLQMRATGELFIVKTTLLQCGCPAPHCPEAGWQHMQIPNQCIQWWRETGWRLMGWHGSTENVESGAIKEKIRTFRRNFRHRNRSTLAGISQDAFSQQSDHAISQTSDGINKHCCKFCRKEVLLIPHLLEAKACLTAFIQEQLPNRAHMYRGKTRLALFDLGLLCRFCPNPNCKGNLESEGLVQHLQGPCLQFYQAEGCHLFSWTPNLSSESIREKLKHRKFRLKSFGGSGQGMDAYQQELASVLKFVCSRCSIQGPLMGSEVHNVWGAGISLTSHEPLWECTRCRGDDELHHMLVMHAAERVIELGTASEFDDTLTQVLVEDQDQRKRVVFVPSALLCEPNNFAARVNDEELNPNTTTVLVPKNPEALDQIGDDATERANTNKKSLQQVAEFFGRRHLFAPVTPTLSVFYRLKLAQIRLERLSMMGTLKKTSKGKIISRDPNHAEVKDRHSHYAETQKFCLTNTCSWSSAAKEKRSKESAARSCVNGQVKIKAEVTVVKKLAVDNGLLRDIIFCLTSSPHGPASLISLAPTVLNFVKAKLRLLVKHIIAPTYSNWDFELKFAEQEWTVRMVVYLYCKEFEGLNNKIARGEILPREFTKEVRRHASVLPTAALSARRIREDYFISEDRAQVRTLSFHGLSTD